MGFGQRSIDLWRLVTVTGAACSHHYIDEARKPAVVKKNEIKFAFLHYNLTGPRECYAAPCKVGCAYVRIATAYCNDRAEPGLVQIHSAKSICFAKGEYENASVFISKK